MFKKILVVLTAGIGILAISALSFAMECGAHKSHQQIAQAESDKQSDTGQEAVIQKETKEAVNVGNKICPVMGNKIDEETKVTYEYEGKIYNFCCPMCIEEFKKDPEKYIKKVGEELQAASKESATGENKTMPETVPIDDMHGGHHSE